MYSKARIGKQPVHPKLVVFPIAFYTGTLGMFIAYAATNNPLWFRMGFVMNLLGVATAALAAIPGAIDLLAGVPSGTPAKRTGLKHMAANVTALVLFALNAFLIRGEWHAAQPMLHSAIALPALGMALTLVAGWLGGRMVSIHHVGVELLPEQERYEPTPDTRSPLAS